MNRAVELLRSFTHTNGDTTYGLEGVFRAITSFAGSLHDREAIRVELEETRKRFNLEKTNRYFTGALDALTRADAEN